MTREETHTECINQGIYLIVDGLLLAQGHENRLLAFDFVRVVQDGVCELKYDHFVTYSVGILEIMHVGITLPRCKRQEAGSRPMKRCWV